MITDMFVSACDDNDFAYFGAKRTSLKYARSLQCRLALPLCAHSTLSLKSKADD